MVYPRLFQHIYTRRGLGRVSNTIIHVFSQLWTNTIKLHFFCSLRTLARITLTLGPPAALDTLFLERRGCITKTRLYNFDPLKPHFYMVKLGFTGVYIIFLISVQNIDCGYSLGEAVLTSTHNLYFEQKYEKYQSFLSENFLFLAVKISIYLTRRIFVMGS